MEIFRDGVSYAIVVLSEENFWSYTWTVPEDGADWMVMERNIPDGYAVTVEERGRTFLLTNTWYPEPSYSEEDSGSDDAPQTGDTPHILFYTIMLYASGITMVALGISGRRKRA